MHIYVDLARYKDFTTVSFGWHRIQGMQVIPKMYTQPKKIYFYHTIS